MGTLDDNTGAGVKPYPRPSPPRALSFAFGALAAVAGFLGYCEVSGGLALLSLAFNLWDFYQYRGGSPRRPATRY
ncbi:MAG TPA: hypothetical protein VKK31_31150 [Thermoanaerobaculia bacterium]|nr:hypothetical protein [Thermoanaerobaculia bacterium]